MLEQELRAYCREAERALACDKSHREAFRRFIEKSAREYQSERPDASFDELRVLLGDPRDAAALFMDTLPPGTEGEWRRKKRRNRRLAGLAVALVVAALAGVLAWFYVTDGVLVIHTKTVITEYPEGMYESVDEMPTPPPIE